MKAAENLSAICKGYACSLYLKSEQFCVDPKSTLGVLALMYACKDKMDLDFSDMDASLRAKFLSDIQPYIVEA